MKGYRVPTNFSNAAQFYPDNSGELGGFAKAPVAQTLVTLDYTQALSFTPGVTIKKVAYILDVQTTPLLIISNSAIAGALLTFILSGGWGGITYNLTVQATLSDNTVRTDVLQIEVMGDDCMGYDSCRPVGRAIRPAPIPDSYNQALLSGQCSSYKSGCITYFICDTPPTTPRVLDQWFNTTNHTVQEYLTDGVNFWWQPFYVDVKYAASSLYYQANANQNSFYTLAPDMNGKSGMINATNVVQAYVNGVRLVPGSDFTVNQQASTVTFARPIPLDDIVMIDILAAPNP
jgi:hypothetical protein